MTASMTGTDRGGVRGRGHWTATGETAYAHRKGVQDRYRGVSEGRCHRAGPATSRTVSNCGPGERQREILAEMERTGGYSATFARAMVVKTPARLRNRARRRNPWRKTAATGIPAAAGHRIGRCMFGFLTGVPGRLQWPADAVKVLVGPDGGLPQGPQRQGTRAGEAAVRRQRGSARPLTCRAFGCRHLRVRYARRLLGGRIVRQRKA